MKDEISLSSSKYYSSGESSSVAVMCG